MVVVFLRKLTKICSLWNRTRKELLFIGVLIILVLHYAFLNDSLNARSTELTVKELPLVRWHPWTDNVTCKVPKLDPMAGEIAKYERLPMAIICGGEDWVRCYHSKCNQTVEIQEKFLSITCEFRDILSSDMTNFTLGPATRLGYNETYDLIKSDYVKVSCSGINITDGKAANWSGVATALRAMPNPPVITGINARRTSFNVMVIVFDTLSANGFQRLMPASFKALKEELRATILRGYSTIGGGTASALLPILTGKTEMELMDAKKNNPDILETVQLLYRKLKERGYRTGFFQDIPSKGTILDSLGFRDPPADHLFHKYILEDGGNESSHCIGDTPEYKLLLNVTEQFLDLDGNRFGLTFIADLTQNDFSMVQSADDDTAASLLAFRQHTTDTLLVVMSDHGPRNKLVRDTWQGRLEERMPLMAIVLPRQLMRMRPRAAAALAENSDVVTTPYDLHATLLDVLGMEKGVTRGRSLLDPIPKNRTCSDVGVEPHWCVCLSWDQVKASDPMFQRTADELVQYINSLLTEAGRKCAPRNLTSIVWVMRQIMPSSGLSGSNQDGNRRQENNPNYQIKVVLGPGQAKYEATMLYIEKEDKFIMRSRHISRTNMFAYESLCIADTHPHLGPFCQCQY